MANTSFRIGRYATTTTAPAEPIIAAWPLVPFGPVVQYPRPSKRDGYGNPAGIVGLPWCDFGRPTIMQAGINVYNALFTYATDESIQVKCQLFDQRTNSWKIYKGLLWRPMIGKSVPGKAYKFADFKATITELVELAGWSST